MRIAAPYFSALHRSAPARALFAGGVLAHRDERQREIACIFSSCIQKVFLLFRSEKGRSMAPDPAGKIYERRRSSNNCCRSTTTSNSTRTAGCPKRLTGSPSRRKSCAGARQHAAEPEALDSPAVALTPLLEAESGRVRLEMPGDFMRLGRTVEFVDVKATLC